MRSRRRSGSARSRQAPWTRRRSACAGDAAAAAATHDEPAHPAAAPVAAAAFVAAAPAASPRRRPAAPVAAAAVAASARDGRAGSPGGTRRGGGGRPGRGAGTAAPEPAPAAEHHAGIEDVEGIGPAEAEKLAAIGITTTAGLLAAGAKPDGRERIAAASGSAASSSSSGSTIVDLMRIKGVGSEYSDLLEVAGVDSPAELAHRNAANLATTVQEVVAARPDIVRRVPTESEIAGWIQRGRPRSTRSSSTDRPSRLRSRRGRSGRIARGGRAAATLDGRRSGGTADAAVLNTAARKGVRVRISAPAPAI